METCPISPATYISCHLPLRHVIHFLYTMILASLCTLKCDLNLDGSVGHYMPLGPWGLLYWWEINTFCSWFYAARGRPLVTSHTLCLYTFLKSWVWVTLWNKRVKLYSFRCVPHLRDSPISNHFEEKISSMAWNTDVCDICHILL
jgi:hypothetical protein